MILKDTVKNKINEYAYLRGKVVLYLPMGTRKQNTYIFVLYTYIIHKRVTIKNCLNVQFEVFTVNTAWCIRISRYLIFNITSVIKSRW